MNDIWDVKVGDTVSLNCELQIGNGWLKKKTILPKDTLFKVVDALIGFHNHYLYVQRMGDDRTYKFKCASLDLIPPWNGGPPYIGG